MVAKGIPKVGVAEVERSPAKEPKVKPESPIYTPESPFSLNILPITTNRESPDKGKNVTNRELEKCVESGVRLPIIEIVLTADDMIVRV